MAMEGMRRALFLVGVCMLSACDSTNTAPAVSRVSPQAGVGSQQSLPASVAVATDLPPSDSSATIEVLQSKEGLTARAGNFSLQMKAAACQGITADLAVCHRDIELVVSTTDGKIRQILDPEAVLVAGKALIYRGAITKANKPDTHTFVLSDLNADGQDDLMIWSGREGAYGGPSFDVYLFDHGELRFVISQPFSDLTPGYIGLFTVENGKITTQSVSGCCVHIRETYVVESNAPKLIERVTEDSTQGKDSVHVKTERLVAGELMEVPAN